MPTTPPDTSPPAAAPERLRVLHLLPDLAIGGGQTIVLQHARRSDANAFDIRIAYLGGCDDLAASFTEAGCPPVTLAHEPGIRALARTLVRATRLLRRDRIDVLHVHSGSDRKIGQVAALLARVPVVGHLHSEWVHLGVRYPDGASPLRRLRGKAAGRGRDWIERRSVRHYIAESNAVRHLFAPLVHAPVAVLQQAIPVDRFDVALAEGARKTARASLGVDEGTPLVINVSRLVEGKGQADLVRAMAAARDALPDAVLLLVGDGDRRAAVEAEVRRLGLDGQVRFLGNRFDIPQLLVAADVFVFASETEGFGLAVLEAMAAGLPVVAYRLPALEEFMVDGVTGCFVPLGDVDGLAARVVELVADPARRRSLGRNGRRVVEERFPADAVARSFAPVHRYAAAARARRKKEK